MYHAQATDKKGGGVFPSAFQPVFFLYNYTFPLQLYPKKNLNITRKKTVANERKMFSLSYTLVNSKSIHQIPHIVYN